MTTLPVSIGNITELYLNGNQLTTLPDSIGNLTHLTELYLSGNQLTTLPESIENLTNITEYLRGNLLTDEEIVRLTRIFGDKIEF